MDAKAIIQKIRDTRKSLGISQRQLAKMAKMSEQGLIKLEKMRCDPGLSRICRLYAILETEVQKVSAMKTNLESINQAFRAPKKQIA